MHGVDLGQEVGLQQLNCTHCSAGCPATTSTVRGGAPRPKPWANCSRRNCRHNNPIRIQVKGLFGSVPSGFPVPSKVLALSRLDRYRSLLLPLLAGIGTLSLVWAFIRISSEMVEGDTRGFDMLLLQWAHSMRAGHPWVVEVMRDFSGLGSTAVLVLFTAATAGSWPSTHRCSPSWTPPPTGRFAAARSGQGKWAQGRPETLGTDASSHSRLAPEGSCGMDTVTRPSSTVTTHRLPDSLPSRAASAAR